MQIYSLIRRTTDGKISTLGAIDQRGPARVGDVYYLRLYDWPSHPDLHYLTRAQPFHNRNPCYR